MVMPETVQKTLQKTRASNLASTPPASSAESAMRVVTEVTQEDRMLGGRNGVRGIDAVLQS
jgi:hypothetical protein